MIIIENKKTEFAVIPGQPETLHYSDLMKMILEKVSQEGFTISEMKKAFKMIDIFEAATKENRESFDLELDEFTLFIRHYPPSFRWGMLNRDIAAFDDYIRAIPLTNPE